MVGASFETKEFWSRLLLVRDGEAGIRVLQLLAVDSLDVDGQALGVILGLIAVKTCALPLKIQIVLEVPGILLDVGDTSVRSRAGCVVTKPLLGEMYSIQSDVRCATGLVFSMCFEAQDLEGCQRGVVLFAA